MSELEKVEAYKQISLEAKRISQLADQATTAAELEKIRKLAEANEAKLQAIR